ncbi:non-ribosomal peptide synthetase [Kordia jejudonensis]|uniref:non-ribosomal peptide synthetase n=1 Tax=Kordia jejudonensis TaxID=1348245 RepID=UPI0006291540|nr:non-ribosomal peptide synthetase [Kordia jejudonensis]
MEALLTKLKDLRISVRLKEGKLDVKAPKGVMNLELLSEIKENKPAIIDFLSSQALDEQQTEAIPQVPLSSDGYKLSSSQYRLWMISQFAHIGTAYNMNSAFEIKGNLDIAALQKAFNALLKRHEILRTVFKRNSLGDVKQFVLAENEYNFAIKTLNISKEDAVETVLKENLEEDLNHNFDLENDILLKVSVFQKSETTCVLSITIHHIISDGWSTEIMVNELFHLYQAIVNNTTPTLAPLSIQYKDYAAWQRRQLSTKSMLKAQRYWQEKFNTAAPTLDLQSNGLVRPKVRTFKGNSLKHIFNDELITEFKAYCESQGATIFMGLLAALKVLVHKYTDDEDIVIGTPVAGRSQYELQNQLGLYINTLALRTTFKKEDSFETFLKQIQKNTIEAHEYQEFPFDQLVKSLFIRRENRHPLFDVMMIYQNEEQSKFDEAFTLGNITLKEIFPIPVETSKFDLEISVIKSKKGARATFTYNTDIHRHDFVKSIGIHLENLLAAILKNPSKSIYEYQILSEREKEFVLKENNQTATPIAATTFLEIFQEQVKIYEDKVAVEDEKESYTYEELESVSEAVKQRILNITEGRKIAVGIMVERSASLLPILLGVLKSGCTYIPIDASLPTERIQHIVDHSQVEFVITNVNKVQEISALEILHADAIIKPLAKDTFVKNIEVSIAGSDAAYIIYTSGSTGKPKGVEISHGALLNFLTSIAKKPGVTADDIVFAVTTYSFDISILEFFTGLIVGAKVYVASKNLLIDAGKIIEKLDTYQPTIIQATPSFYQMLFEFGWKGNSGLKVFCGGDALAPSLAEKLIENTAELWNMYGPTETTIWSSIHKIEHPKDASNIGYPIANTQLYVLGKQLEPKPIHTVGTLYIGGKGLANGYYKAPEITEARFITSPFNAHEKIYNTGDLVRRNADGSLLFLGREDYQVKIRGYRIELGDIEANIIKYKEAISQVVVVANEEENAKALVAYYVASEEIDKKALVKHLKEKLPQYMIPNHFVAIEIMPLTPNGKIDRKRLPKVGADDIIKSTYVAPETDTEKYIAKIWREELKVEKIGVLDNFFELGGHSLFIVKIINNINVELDKVVSFDMFFANQDIRSLSATIDAIPKETREIKIPKSTHKGPYFDVSRSQYRLWVTSQLGGTKAFNIPLVFDIEGDYDPDIYHIVLKNLVKRHDSLRTSFKMNENNQVQQYVTPYEDFDIKFKNYTTLTSLAEAKRIITEVVNDEFDLANGPLLKAGTIKIGENKYSAYLIIHHLVIDGWSMEIVFQEIIQHFNALLQTGKLADFEPLEIQYTDYSQYLQDNTETVIKKEKDFWNAVFKNQSPYLRLPFERERRPLKKTYNGDFIGMQIDKENTTLLKELCASNGATNFAGLMAIFKILLWKYTNENDLTIGIPISGRINSQLEPQVGLYLNTLPVRSSFDENQTFLDIIKNENERLVSYYDNQLYHIDDLINDLDIKTPQGRSPLFDILMVFQNQATLNIFNNFHTVESDFNIKLWNDIEVNHAQFDISVAFTESKYDKDRGIYASISFNTDVYEYDHIARLLDDYKYLISQALRYKNMSISEFFEKTSYTFINDEEIIFKIDDTASLEDEVNLAAEAIPENADLKEKLHKIIAKHLDVEITYDNDYFASGGSSLGAIQIVNELNAALGKRYNIIEFYQHPSVNTLHNFIVQKTEVNEEKRQDDNLLMTLHHTSEEVPNVVFFPPVFGEGIIFNPLTTHIKDEFNSYAFNVPPLDDAQNTMELLVNSMVKNIEQQVHTNNPVYFVGYSIGVNYAYEVAKKMENVFPEIKLLLIDRGALVHEKARITGRLIKRILKEQMPLIKSLGLSEAETERLQTQIRQSLERLENYEVTGSISSPIYALEAEGNGFSDYMQEWSKHTSLFMGVQKLKGTHLEALNAPNDTVITDQLKAAISNLELK